MWIKEQMHRAFFFSNRLQKITLKYCSSLNLRCLYANISFMDNSFEQTFNNV